MIADTMARPASKKCTTDPDALARKGSGREAKLSYNGNLLTGNRNGFIITTEVFP